MKLWLFLVIVPPILGGFAIAIVLDYLIWGWAY